MGSVGQAFAAVIILSLFGLSASAGELTQTCATNQQLTGECFVVHGRLTIGNGTPSVRIWPIGTKRLLGVVNADGMDSEDEQTLPANLSKLTADAPFDTELFGDFKVCPLTAGRPGWMQMVCIAGTKAVTVKRERP